jgi:hypothetical protein
MMLDLGAEVKAPKWPHLLRFLLRDLNVVATPEFWKISKNPHFFYVGKNRKFDTDFM